MFSRKIKKNIINLSAELALRLIEAYLNVLRCLVAKYLFYVESSDCRVCRLSLIYRCLHKHHFHVTILYFGAPLDMEYANLSA